MNQANYDRLARSPTIASIDKDQAILSKQHKSWHNNISSGIHSLRAAANDRITYNSKIQSLPS